VTANLTDSLTVEAGLRYYSYHSDLSSTATGFAYGGDTPVIAAATASASGLNPMLDVSYHLNPDLMLYATAAKGFREGAGNFPIPTTGSVGSVCLQNLQAIGRDSAPGQYDPDTVWSYEIGEKGRFLDQRITFNSDVFYIRWSDVQQPVALACGLGFTANGSAANIRGAEAELQAEIVTGLTFSQGVGYAHSAFAQGFAASGIVAGQSLFDAPELTINSSLSYARPVGDVTLVGLLRNSYAGSSEDLSYQVNRLPGRDRLDLRAGVETRKWSAFLFVDNVLNRHNILENIDLLTFTGPSYNRVATDRPLTAGIDISFTF
jgi:outer membrane receptor protein involved in Fe transport